MKRILFLFVLLCSVALQAQTFKLRGVVSDDRDPLPGVSIQIKGKAVGTVTGIDGAYTIDVSKGETLVASYVGYKTQEIIYRGEPVLNIKLKEAVEELQEAVVVGYAKQKKATLTGSVSSLSSSTLNKRTVASLSTALQGTMPGVTVMQTSGQPGDDGASIRIRGIGSINSTSSPLVLVDGIEMDINTVDMNTVESISVLKDAASASIYGSRASNGVVLITTKRGSEGKVSVTYNGYVSLQRPTNMPSVVSAADYLEAELASWDNAGRQTTDDVRAARLQLIQDYRTYQADNWERYDTDWKSATIYDNALMTSHNVGVSGGNKNLRYYGSGSYMYQDGLIPNNSYDRTNLRMNADANITSWMRFALETNLRQSNTITPAVGTPKSIINQALYMLPTLSAARELDGNWGYGKNGLNPTAEAYASGKSKSQNSETIVNGTLTITPIKNLDIEGQYSRRIVTSKTRKVITPYTVSLKGNIMGQYPAEDGVSEGWSETIRNYYRLQASYTNGIGQNNFRGLIGFQAEDNTNTAFSTSMRGFDLGKYYLANGDTSTSSSTGSGSAWSMMSYYARLNYNYGEKYLVEANARLDGSSRFIHDRWGFFPSISAGWVISQEKFMESTQDWLSFLKLRASYGLLGNQSIGSNYPYAATISSGYSYWFDKDISSGVVQASLANPYISWEKSRQYNIGVDATFWNGKLSVTGEYYIKQIYDMLMKFPLPYYAGTQPAYSNAGDMENKGWEINLTHRNKIGKFNYSVTFTLSDAKNKVTDLKGLSYEDKSIMEGYPLNGIWGYLTDGYYQNWDDVYNSPKLSSAARPGFVKYKKIYTGEGVDEMQIDSRDQVYLGDNFPHYEYGLNLTGQWKGFDLTVFFQGVCKRSIYMSGIGLKPFYNGSNLFKHQMDSWTEDNPNAAYPILLPEDSSTDNFQKSDKWVKNGAYLRLKNVMLGYSLPSNITRKMKISNLRFYVSGQNIFTIDGFYDGYDPETSYGGTTGGEFYPIMQTFTFGVDFKF
jgi:TonB-linked SusC/RagA family outer membrane protein